MTNCTLAHGEKVLASEVLWESIPATRLAVLVIGTLLAAATLILYLWLIWRQASQGRRAVQGENNFEHGAHFLPPKVRIQEQMLYLGPIMSIFFLVQMCVPELMTMADMAQTTYRAITYYLMLQLVRLQFGFEWNTVRDDGSGTLQQHEPYKLWKKPPCCCVWAFFLPCMKERIINRWDVLLIGVLTKQFCFVGPAMAALKMVAHYEGVSRDRIASLFLACNIISTISLVTAVYAVQVATGIVESCEPIQYQVRRRSWFHAPNELGKEPAPVKNISVKNTWIVIATVLPALASIIVSLVIKDDLCTDSGNVLRAQDRQEHIIAFIGLVFNFLAALFAIAKAFPIPTRETRTDFLEHVSANYLAMELWPQFALDFIPANVVGIIEERKQAGKDVNLGFRPNQQWREVFGEYRSAPAQAVMLGASKESDDTKSLHIEV